MTGSSRLHGMECARRAAERAASRLHREWGRGAKSVAIIARISPWIGALGTAALLVDALTSYNDANFSICDCSSGFSEILVPTALSLAVTIVAQGAFGCLRHQIETLDREMHTATLELLNSLSTPTRLGRG